ncbi:GatB/YqeY domain-containing protein [Flagellimonas nanhaiensis]|uniref:GatB/YqeY domain-containing protein n=1 Tax=Flagellimonas nanhaiensis TaxID=2292706 RepID=A0A371JNT0_9FLAO|nr:GatB/YqeY domain-containing protein [Allomuricauda nanhaiensis]RDY58896.1 GatB/YqeY domain-containing protein [Allomuricauda nanhaiensis]
MSLQEKVMTEMKAAMKAKDSVALESLRAIKSAILLAKTDKGAGGELSEEDEVKLVQKLVKQRKDSAAIFQEQGREDLAEPELAQVAVIEKFLPEQLTEEEIEKVVVLTIEEIGATGMQEMGRVMGMVTKELAGQADGKTISSIVKAKLSS